jgi:AbrB family looped-hinge helix DNA binding protein
MKHNIVTLDTKGRILVPYHIRELLDLNTGSEFVIMSNYNGEIKLLPLIKGKATEVRVLFEDKPGSLTRITEKLAKENVDIILSQSKVIERGHLAEWHAIADTSECAKAKSIDKLISRIPIVKKVSVNAM